MVPVIHYAMALERQSEALRQAEQARQVRMAEQARKQGQAARAARLLRGAVQKLVAWNAGLHAGAPSGTHAAEGQCI